MIFGGIVRGDFQHGVTTFSFFGLPSLGQAKKVKILRFLGQSFLFNKLLSIAQGVQVSEETLMVHQRTRLLARPGAARRGARLRLLVAWTSPPA
jgi:hypothetical protein